MDISVVIVSYNTEEVLASRLNRSKLPSVNLLLKFLLSTTIPQMIRLLRSREISLGSSLLPTKIMWDFPGPIIRH